MQDLQSTCTLSQAQFDRIIAGESLCRHKTKSGEMLPTSYMISCVSFYGACTPDDKQFVTPQMATCLSYHMVEDIVLDHFRDSLPNESM
jgi:hypothetical protein